MSNDLISRKALIEDLMGQIPLAENVYIFKQIIEDHPTAYDVENVVEELHNASCDYEAHCKSNKCKCKNCNHYVLGCKNAIDIVRKGGVE